MWWLFNFLPAARVFSTVETRLIAIVFHFHRTFAINRLGGTAVIRLFSELCRVHLSASIAWGTLPYPTPTPSWTLPQWIPFRPSPLLCTSVRKPCAWTSQWTVRRFFWRALESQYCCLWTWRTSWAREEVCRRQRSWRCWESTQQNRHYEWKVPGSSAINW